MLDKKYTFLNVNIYMSDSMLGTLNMTYILEFVCGFILSKTLKAFLAPFYIWENWLGI